MGEMHIKMTKFDQDKCPKINEQSIILRKSNGCLDVEIGVG
jgi:hypothetical protein